MKTERIRVCFYNVDLGKNSPKEDGILGEDMNIVQQKSFHQRGSALVNPSVAFEYNTTAFLRNILKSDCS